MKDSSVATFIQPLAEPHFSKKLSKLKEALQKINPPRIERIEANPTIAHIHSFAVWLPLIHSLLISKQLKCILYAMPLLATHTTNGKPR
jgi:hypothetical protein